MESQLNRVYSGKDHSGGTVLESKVWQIVVERRKKKERRRKKKEKEERKKEKERRFE